MRIGIEETLFYELKRDASLPEISLQGILIMQLGTEQLPEFCELSGERRELVEQRWRAQDRCYLAYAEKRLAHFSWVKSEGVHAIYEADTKEPVQTGHFWIYHCATAAWARGRNIYPFVLQKIVSDYFGAGYQCANIHSTSTNLASRRGIEKAGFQYVFSKKAVRVGSHWFGWRGRN